MKTKKRRTILIRIGEDTVSYKMDSKRQLDLEMLFLNLVFFIAVFAFSLDYLPAFVFLLLFPSFAMRIFMCDHARWHANLSDRLPGFIEAIAEGLFLVVTPWDEPFNSVRRKHLAHHTTHISGVKAKFDTNKDPHSAYELGGVIRVLFSCLFYEEFQLYLDIRDKKLKRSRLYRFLIYLPLIMLYIYTFGWSKYLVLFIAVRFTGFFVWFVFSYVFHLPHYYTFGVSKPRPKWVVFMNNLLFGRKIAKGTLSHAAHHAWPAVPNGDLHKIDSAVIRNPDSRPLMHPT